VALRHARHLAEFPDVDIVAVTDVDQPAAQAFADATGAAAAPDLYALLDASLDAVYVCVPPHAHGDIEMSVVAAGVAVFVEKPIGIDVSTARRVAGLARERGVVTAVGHHWRYSDAIRQVRELLDGRPVRLVVGSWLDKVPPPAWWAKRLLSGGQIVEQAVHVLDLIRFLTGEVDEVTSYVNTTPPGVPDADVDGATAAILRLHSGAVASVTATCCLGWKHLAGLDLYADNMSVSIHEDRIAARMPEGVMDRQLDPDAAKIAADRAFVNAVLGADRDRILVDYSDALRTHELACAIALSAVERHPVRLHG
jgi:myo-inositol 2-dehydrogenase / D-chiro-inositol 1-dehydrogenase